MHVVHRGGEGMKLFLTNVCCSFVHIFLIGDGGLILVAAVDG